MVERIMIDIRDSKHCMEADMWREAIDKAFRRKRTKITIIRGDGSVHRNYCEKKDTIQSNSERV